MRNYYLHHDMYCFMKDYYLLERYIWQVKLPIVLTFVYLHVSFRKTYFTKSMI